MGWEEEVVSEVECREETFKMELFWIKVVFHGMIMKQDTYWKRLLSLLNSWLHTRFQYGILGNRQQSLQDTFVGRGKNNLKQGLGGFGGVGASGVRNGYGGNGGTAIGGSGYGDYGGTETGYGASGYGEEGGAGYG